MNKIILASHGDFSQGLKQTSSMIIGDEGNIFALSAFRDEDEPIRTSRSSFVCRDESTTGNFNCHTIWEDHFRTNEHDS